MTALIWKPKITYLEALTTKTTDILKNYLLTESQT